MRGGTVRVNSFYAYSGPLTTPGLHRLRGGKHG
jgi:hypothetical protein